MLGPMYVCSEFETPLWCPIEFKGNLWGTQLDRLWVYGLLTVVSDTLGVATVTENQLR